MIRDLLAEAGKTVEGKETQVHAVAPSRTVTTPETYLGAARAERFTNAMTSRPARTTSPRRSRSPPTNSPTTASGTSRSTRRPPGPAPRSTSTSARAASIWCSAPPGRTARSGSCSTAQPISAADAGSDVHGGAVTVSGQRLYNLVDLPKVGHHVLTLEPEAGVEGYAFTFG